MFTTSKVALVALIATQFSSFSLGHPVLEERTAPIVMGLAKSFAAVAATTITSTGATMVTGNIGTCPGTAITGFGPGMGTCSGSIDKDTTAACNAEAACLTAYNDIAALVPTGTLSTDLAGKTLNPGVYGFTTLNAVLSGTLTLNGTLNTKGQFIFQIKTTFVTAATTANVVLINGAQACNVYFNVGSSATIGAGGKLQGNILAYTAVAVKSGASNKGILCALNAAVTLIDNVLIAQPTCST